MDASEIVSLLERLRAVLPEIAATQPASPAPARQLVTLDQLAARVRRTKDALRKYTGHGLPAPAVRGRRGQPHLFDWAECRTWLERTFGQKLPEKFPIYEE